MRLMENVSLRQSITTTVQLRKSTKARIDRLKVHRLEPIDEVTTRILDRLEELERERREESRPERRKKAS